LQDGGPRDDRALLANRGDTTKDNVFDLGAINIITTLPRGVRTAS